MTKEEKKTLYTCNVGDFLRNFNDKKYSAPGAANAQFADTLTYLAKHNMKGSTKECDFFDLVYAAKTAIINQAANKSKDSPYQQMARDYGDNFDSVQLFLNNPIDYLKDAFKEYADNQEEDVEIDPQKREFDARLKDNTRNLSATLETQASRYEQYEARMKAKDLENRIIGKLPGKAINLDGVFESNKGGFFERSFGRTSQDYKNLVTAFTDYRNPNSVYFGKDEHVEFEAIKYLEHAIPGFRYEGDLPTKAQLDALSGTRKDRTAFCVSVLESVKERREKQEAIEGLMDSIKNDFAIEEESEVDEEQIEFQNQVKKDVADSEDLSEQNENSNDEIQAEKEIEEEDLNNSY